ncbi:MAG: stalk domain-containing protein [Ignavibacteriales bacterium]
MVKSRAHTYVSKIILALYFLTMVWIPVPVKAAQASDLTVSQSVEWALKSDPDIKSMALTVEKAQKARDDAADLVHFIPISGPVDTQTQTIFLGYKQAENALGAAKKSEKLLPQQITKEIIASYLGILKTQNSIDLQKLNLAKLEKQIAASQVAKANGMVSDNDWQTLQNGLVQAKEGLKTAEASLVSSRMAFNTAVGKDKDAGFTLISIPIVESIEKGSLDEEQNRALAASVAVWQAEQNLDLEHVKENWTMLGVDSTNRRIALDQAVINVDNAKQTVKTSIETLYYGIVAMESQMTSAMQAYEQTKADLKTAETKYQLGMIPLISTTGTGDLTSARVNAETKRVALENLKADLTSSKATLYLSTGRTVFDAKDWGIGTGSTVNIGVVNNNISSIVGTVVFTIGKTSYKVGTQARAIDAAPYIKNGRTYVPVRYLGDAVGAQVSWDNTTKTATLTKNGKSIALVIGKYTALANGKYINMEVAPEIVNGRTMLPARYVAEALGNTIDWDETSKQITIYQ